VCLYDSPISSPRSGAPCRYAFDSVFAPSDSQEATYRDVLDLIVLVADSYNVCIMAYRQTGSGTTYTKQDVTSIYRSS
jgi:hypothetical protein